MKEAVISIAALAGLVGLAVVYNSGVENARMRRDTGTTEMAFNESEVENSELEFLQMLGWMDEGANIPEEFIEDVKFYADCPPGSTESDPLCGQRAGGNRKAIQFVVKCLRNVDCKAGAMASVINWGNNNRNYIESNPSVLLRPITLFAVEDPNSEWGMCTPGDSGLFKCSEEIDTTDYDEGEVDFAERALGDSISTHSAMQDLLATNMEESESFAEVANNLNPSGPADSVFNMQGGVKLFLIIPNGVPITMSDKYQAGFRNYWGWFKRFNDAYVGINKEGSHIRQGYHFWFMRQDKTAKLIMKNPAKANKRFPWVRFDKLMGPVQATAVQPKIRGTFNTILEEINAKGMGADYSEGTDCITLWFHQYIPQDMLELADSFTQDNIIGALERVCTVIHFWVGMDNLPGMENTIMVTRYIQGLLQPSQMTVTTADEKLRNWHYVNNLESLGGAEGDDLLKKVYTSVALERKRCTCLLARSGSNVAAILEAMSDTAKASGYDYYGDYGDYNAYEYADGGYEDDYYQAEAYGYEYDTYGEDVATYEGAYYEAVEETEVNTKCCGIGLSGKKYNSAYEECCEDGTTGRLDMYTCY